MDPATAIRNRFPSYGMAQTAAALATTNDANVPAWYPAGQSSPTPGPSSSSPSMMQYAVAAALGVGAGYLAAKYMKKGKKRSKR